MAIFHIVDRVSWEGQKPSGNYIHESLESDGFIHCSEDHQVSKVANAFFSGQSNLLLLKIDPSKLTSKLHYDMADDFDEPFPHIYGPINVDAVEETIELRANQDGKFVFPTDC